MPTVGSLPKLSTTLPPLVFGTATFNYQFNPDPYALHPNDIVHAALLSGIRAFDTSPYYGPAESILGDALHSPLITTSPTLRHLKRSDYHILTKAGRIAGDKFDYSPSWIRHSVRRSLHRLHTTYLDVVYLHDVEFVSPAEVLTGIRTLRQIRDESSTVHYVGICGYPVETLCELAELVLRETGEPLDIVQSYANYTIQNQRLLTLGRKRLIEAGVDVVPNASPLGMGLCRSQGVPVGSMGNWHPAPDGLREACLNAASYVEQTYGDKLETIAVRFAMESWLEIGQNMGSQGPTPVEATSLLTSRAQNGASQTDDTVMTHGEQARCERPKLGVSVMGVSKISELDDTMEVYSAILAARGASDRTVQVNEIVQYIRKQILGASWVDYAWESPDPGFRNTRTVFGVTEAEERELELAEAAQKAQHESFRDYSESSSGSEVESSASKVVEVGPAVTKSTTSEGTDVTALKLESHVEVMEIR